MAKKRKKSPQNIDGVLKQLKESYSTDIGGNSADPIKIESASEEVSGDELQARLRSQFLGGEAQSAEDEVDDYLIDEEFLKDVSNDDVDDDLTENEKDSKESIYGFNHDLIGKDSQNDLQEEAEEASEEDFWDNEEEEEEESSSGYEEAFEGYEEDEESFDYERMEALQEKEYNEASQEIFEDEEAEEAFADGEGSELDSPDDDFFDDDEENSLWSENESYTPLTLEDDEDDAPITMEDIEDYEEEGSAFEIAEDTRTPEQIAEDNYVEAFYRNNEYDPYENMSFKERILDGAPTVDSLEAELGDEAEELAFDKAEDIPSPLDDEDNTASANEENLEQGVRTASQIEELDNSDLALLLEFGYGEEILENVSDEKIDTIIEDEVIYSIDGDDEHDDKDDKPEKPQADIDDVTDENEGANRTEKLKQKLSKQYEGYRKKRGGILLRLIISAVLTAVLFVYELIPLLSSELGGLFNREEYFFAYALVGLQILIFAFLPAVKSIYDSFKNLFSQGISAYFIAGASVTVTLIYDFIVVFVRSGDVPPTFHFCTAVALIAAEISELIKLNAEIKGYEYYFSEYLYDGDLTEVEKIKYTLTKSEGRGSIAEKMYIGGLNDKTLIYAPQSVETTNGFFASSKKASKKNRATFSWIIASVVVATIFTIVSGIIYDKMWIASLAFVITFNLMLPILAVIFEWLPFGKLSSQSYSYGAAFASEGALEDIGKCNMLVFNDLHMFEKCDARSVNLAIYDSTSRAVLLSCLNAVYSEIGGPLQSAFANVNVKSLGKCKITCVARSGVGAVVGTSYSVLIGDEQFMSRYGIFFPKAALGREEDKIFTLCVAINNRATARIAVKYKINETFYSILQKLQEDKISCAVQTYDPMISAELIARVRPYKGAPVNIVHKSSVDYALEKHKHKTGALYSVMSDELPVLARGSRLNLAVALSNAKKLKGLRILLNICSGALISAGAIFALALVLSERLMSVDWIYVLIYWLVSAAVMVGLFIWRFPQKDRFIFNKK